MERAKVDLPYRPAVLVCPHILEQSKKCRDICRLDAFRSTPLIKEPFEHLIVSGFVDAAGLAAINADYPKISTSGSFPVDQVSFGPAFQTLLDELEGDAFREAFEEKFGIDLTDRPTVTTVRGRCDARDGKIHTDSDQQDHHRADLHEQVVGSSPAAGCGCFAPPPISTISSLKCRRLPARCSLSSAATIPGTAMSRLPANAG